MLLRELLPLGLIEICNVTDIPLMIMLLSLCKKRWHALLFPIFAYITYVVEMCLMYLGINKVFRDYWAAFSSDTTRIACIELILAIILIIVTAIYLISTIKKIRRFNLDEIEAAVPFKNIHPAFIIGYSIIASIVLIPLYMPCITMLSILVKNSIPFSAALFYIAGFCMLSQLINIAIYILYGLLTGDRFKSVVSLINKICVLVLAVLIPVALGVVAFLCLKDCIPVLF